MLKAPPTLPFPAKLAVMASVPIKSAIFFILFVRSSILYFSKPFKLLSTILSANAVAINWNAVPILPAPINLFIEFSPAINATKAPEIAPSTDIRFNRVSPSKPSKSFKALTIIKTDALKATTVKPNPFGFAILPVFSKIPIVAISAVNPRAKLLKAETDVSNLFWSTNVNAIKLPAKIAIAPAIFNRFPAIICFWYATSTFLNSRKTPIAVSLTLSVALPTLPNTMLKSYNVFSTPPLTKIPINLVSPNLLIFVFAVLKSPPKNSSAAFLASSNLFFASPIVLSIFVLNPVKFPVNCSHF